MQVQPYLFFDGRCEEAVAFYRSALGAEVTCSCVSRIALSPVNPAWSRPVPRTR
jgi:PhnB protein